MRPTKPDGSMWHAIDSNRMLQHFHRQAASELRARDIARGLPKSLACGKWIGSPSHKVFVVDPLLSRIKQSGEEFGKLRLAKWRAFCAEPRDPQIELAKIGEVPSYDETPRLNLHGFTGTVAEAIKLGIEAGVKTALAAQNNGHPSSAGGLSDKPTALRRRAKSAQLEPTAEVTT